MYAKPEHCAVAILMLRATRKFTNICKILSLLSTVKVSNIKNFGKVYVRQTFDQN